MPMKFGYYDKLLNAHKAVFCKQIFSARDMGRLSARENMFYYWRLTKIVAVRASSLIVLRGISPEKIV
jgi:hypothetical protein